MVTKKLARAADDGYRNALVPGLRATADAERLAAALAAAAARLEPPGPYPEVAAEPDLEEATWLAFLLATGGGAPVVGVEGAGRTADAYRAWAARAGSQAQAFRGEPAGRRSALLARVRAARAARLRARAARFDLLTALGAAGRLSSRPASCGWRRGGCDDRRGEAAARVRRQAAARAPRARAGRGAEVLLGALDRAFAVWGTPGDHADLAAEAPAPIRAALSLR